MSQVGRRQCHRLTRQCHRWVGAQMWSWHGFGCGCGCGCGCGRGGAAGGGGVSLCQSDLARSAKGVWSRECGRRFELAGLRRYGHMYLWVSWCGDEQVCARMVGCGCACGCACWCWCGCGYRWCSRCARVVRSFYRCTVYD